MKWLRGAINWLKGVEHLKGLTQDEYEEYEMLWECYEWRSLTSTEQGRLDELEDKRTEYDRKAG